MNLDDLLATLDNGSGAGDSLDYDPAFGEMERAAQPIEERRMGKEVKAAVEPNHKKVRESALDVLSRSKDVRAAMYLATAALHLDGFPAFAKVTTYMRRCLQEYWETCHPELDDSDENIAVMRRNAILSFCDPKTTLRAIRSAPLSQSRAFGAMTLADIEIANGDIPIPQGVEDPPDEASISAAFRDTDPDTLASLLEAVSTAHADLVAIDDVFSEHVPGQGPDLERALKALAKARSRLAEAVGSGAPEEEPDEEQNASSDSSASRIGEDQRPKAEISGPTDVTAALDRIIAYYQKHEPSSPVPVLLKRAKTLVNAQFIDIIRDMAPAGLDNVVLIAGDERTEDQSG